MDVKAIAQIIDRARTKNGVSSKVCRAALSADISRMYEDIFPDKVEQVRLTPWELVAEEFPMPDRRYKVFAAALAAADPLTVLRDQPADRSPGELYLLQIRIKARADTRLPRVEQSLLDLKTADWAKLSNEQQAVVRKHIEQLRLFYYRTQKRTRNLEENAIDMAVHELAEIFAKHTHFDDIPTDLPHSAPSQFVQFLCLALAPTVHPGKLDRGALSKRWRRLKGCSKISAK